MTTRIMFDWAGNVYEWYIEWPLPFFPRKGETFYFSNFLEAGVIKDFEDVAFVGKGRYYGLEKSIMSFFQNDYHTIIKNINWGATCVEIELGTTLYSEMDSLGNLLWEEKGYKGGISVIRTL